jgi:hypothetical protein
MRTGYEQVRSIVAALAGDRAAADRVELVLPETGVCTLQREGAEEDGCCGSKPAAVAIEPPAPVKGGCGCGSTTPEDSAPGAATVASRCCGGAPKTNAAACCLKDEEAKAAGEEGCGCGARGAAVEEPELAGAGLR